MQEWLEKLKNHVMEKYSLSAQEAERYANSPRWQIYFEVGQSPEEAASNDQKAASPLLQA